VLPYEGSSASIRATVELDKIRRLIGLVLTCVISESVESSAKIALLVLVVPSLVE
jgi:hypothetical protein